ncbi:MAG: hypothetical protein M1834_008551 [Cirrosporium novae-zelandiae]|nr:MAG: hypothetical protein M1834_008551 [Cirrosporium novae-zelandiae]
MSESSEDPSGHPRKRMRKGTKSCLECRRRKIRCTYKPEAQACDECSIKGIHCLGQALGDAKIYAFDKRKNLRERVGELEDQVSQILQRLDAGNHSLNTSERGAVEALKSLRSELLPSIYMSNQTQPRGETVQKSVTVDISAGLSPPITISETSLTPDSRNCSAPVLSLFNNSVICQKGNGQPEIEIPDATESLVLINDKERKVLGILKSFLPSPHDLSTLIDATDNSFLAMFSALGGVQLSTAEEAQEKGFHMEHNTKVLSHYIADTLKDTNPSVVMRSLLCITLCLQQLPSDVNFSYMCLSCSPQALAEHILESIDTLLRTNDALAASTAGFDSIKLIGKYYMNAGKPRKAYLTYCRAMSLCQLLGLNRPAVWKDDTTGCKKELFAYFFRCQTFMGALLGLPASFAFTHIDVNALMQGNYWNQLGMIAGQIIDRDQDPSGLSFSKTLQVDQELEDSKSFHSPDWWSASAASLSSIKEINDNFATKLWFYHLKVLLHLPFMLKSITDPRYEFSRIAALDASRNMLLTYETLRAQRGNDKQVCRITEFLVFIGSMILVLDRLASANTVTSTTDIQRTKDWETISRISCHLREVSVTRGSGVAAQAVRVLDTFNKSKEYDPDCSDQFIRCVIPYVGAITIGKGKSFADGHQATPKSLQASIPSDSLELNLTPPLSFNDFPSGLEFQPWQDFSISSGQFWQPLAGSDDLNMDWNGFLNNLELPP